MNIKERLETYKNTNIQDTTTESNLDNINTEDIFLNDISAKNIILDLINKNKNIVFVCNKIEDNQIAANYFQSITGITIYENIENITDFNFNNFIIQNVQIPESVKIFEYIISENKRFIFGINLKQFDNTIEKIKAIIAVNYKNLTAKNIYMLLSSSDLVFVFVMRNEDGLYYISEINELVCTGEELYFEPAYKIICKDNKYTKQTETETEKTEEDKKEDREEIYNTEEEVKIEEIEEENQEEYNKKENDNTEEVIKPEEQADSKSKLKINKYKLLKEKIKNKKQNS